MERTKTRKRKTQPKPKDREFDVEEDRLVELSEAEEMEAMEAIGDSGPILNYLRFRRANLQRKIIKFSHYKIIGSQQIPLTLAALQGRLELVEQILSKADAARKTKELK